ncbi:MAG: helix-turn-helix domain-containing protein [Alphaproteobacteria bacterium]|nr:helix-turn-helix domain-containing protein [Alphaproteobacteria bacterium]
MAVIKFNQPPVSNPDPSLSPCAACSVRDLSICGVLDETELQKMAAIAYNMRFSAQDPIIDEGEPAEFLFNITGGTVRLYKLLPDGRRQITGFLSSGDFLGIALNESYAYSAEAVDPVMVCRFPRRKLESLLDEFPHLEKRLLGLASNELAQAQDQMVLLGRKTAKEKVVSFLLALSRRQEVNGGALTPVALPMSRSDIADYLGLTTETVSRTFSSLKRDQSIRIEEGGNIALPDIEALETIAEGF